MRRREALDAVSEVTAEQAGYVTTNQAARLGVPVADVQRLEEGGDLRRVRQGVYALRPTHSSYEDEIAAWLHFAHGVLPWEREDQPIPNAVVSSVSAAGMLDLGTIVADLPTVTLPLSTGRKSSSASNLRAHSASVRPTDWEAFEGAGMPLPVTTPSRTIVDLVLDGQEPSYLQRAVAEAIERGIATPDSLLEAARNRKRTSASLEARVSALIGSAT